MIKLIASDMDGTLLPYVGAHVDPEMFDVIRTLKKHGVRFMTSSGRQYTNLTHEFQPVVHDIDFLCQNGCVVFHEGKLFMKEEMPQDIAHRLIDDFLNTPGYECLVDGVYTCYVLKGHDAFYHLLKDKVHNATEMVDDLHNIPEPYFKISGWRKDGDRALQEIERYWEPMYRGKLTCTYGGNGYVDFSPLHVSKGTAILKYMQKVGFKRDEVMAFGDNYNDEEMLDNVEYSFAMRRAPQEIKDFCYGVTDNVKDTIKEFFHQWF